MLPPNGSRQGPFELWAKAAPCASQQPSPLCSLLGQARPKQGLQESGSQGVGRTQSTKERVEWTHARLKSAQGTRHRAKVWRHPQTVTSDPPRGLQAGATPGGVWHCLFKVRQPEAFGMEAEGLGSASSKEGVLGLHLQPAAGAHHSRQQQQQNPPQRAVRECTLRGPWSECRLLQHS